MILSKQLETEITAAYKSFWVANLSADMKQFASYLVDDFSIFGSAKGETFFTRENAVAFYSATAEELKDKAALRNRDIRIQPIDEHNVIVLELSDLYVLIAEDWTFYGHARISCVMKKTGDAWKALHQHASFPDHRTEEGQQLASEKIASENLELKEAVQRRTAELHSKNRELEIEAAVERVRAQSMAMQQTSDIAKVNEELFAQVAKLNIDGFTGLAFYLVGDDGMVTVWDLSSPGSMGDATNFAFKYDPKLTPNLAEFIPIWQDGKTDYFIMDFPKERLMDAVGELEAYYPAMAENFRSAIESGTLEHQWNPSAVITDGIFSLDLMKPPTDEVKSITVKMAAAFNLGYQRFNDLQKAEAQTRESQIQLALERVRARTMAMQHSDELADASFLLDTQVRSLGIQTAGCAFNIYGENKSSEWFSSEMGAMPRYKTPREKLFLRYYEAGQRGEVIHIESYEGEACKSHYEYLCSIPIMGDALRDMIAAGGSFPVKQVDHAVYFKYGYLLFITLEPVPAAHDIFIRFAKVFEQTYTRFLDLQKSEEQSREAQIEGALEKVRSSSLAMQKSEELKEVIQVVYEQMVHLGVNTEHAGFVIDYKQRDDRLVWVASRYAVPSQLIIPYFDSEYYNRFNEAKDKGLDFFETRLSFDDKNAFYKELFKHIPGLPADAKEFYFSCPGLAISTVLSDNVALYIENFEGIPYSQEDNVILMRFCRVFQQTYTRFLDLQKAEAQALRAEQDVVMIKAARQKAEETLLELKETQKQLIQSEKMASLGELTAGIAHEIQNPLNFVNNFSDVSSELMDEMNAELDKGDIEEARLIAQDIKSNLEKINHHGKRADAIVKGMLQHSRKSEGTKEPTDINALCDEYLRLAYHGLRAKDKTFNAGIKTDFDKSIGKINIVPQDMGRVIMNLLTNAFYAVNEKNRAGSNYEPVVSISTKKTGNEVQIIITDNGNGIPAGIIEKIFQPFFTTKPTGSGTGLGLSLSYDIVKAHGGTLEVETAEGEYTRFIINLPV